MSSGPVVTLQATPDFRAERRDPARRDRVLPGSDHFICGVAWSFHGEKLFGRMQRSRPSTIGRSRQTPDREVSIRVAIPVFGGVSAATVVGLFDVLSSAGRAWQAMTGDPPPSRLFEPILVAERTGNVACANGATVQVTTRLEDAGRLEAVVIGAIMVPPPEVPSQLSRRLLRWIGQAREAGSLLGGVCSGTLALAECGVLDGMEATTHWSYAGYFRERYPRVRLRPERLLVECPCTPPIVTVGGGSSWHDLALHLIGRHLGNVVAAQTARVFLMNWHDEEQTVYACLTPTLARTDGAIARAQQVMRQEFQAADVPDRALRASGLNARTYQRRFRAATGMSPTQHLQAVRMERAKALLEAGTVPVTDIGVAVGYEDPTFFRRVFRKLTGLSPGLYRRRFGGRDACDISS